MYPSEKDQYPGGTVKEPAVIAIVLIVELLGIDQTGAHQQEQKILQNACDEKEYCPIDILHLYITSQGNNNRRKFILIFK